MNLMWKVNYKAMIQTKDYCVTGYRLYDTAWFGDDGMSDCAMDCPKDEYKLIVESWYKNRWGRLEAGTLSDVKLTMDFKGRDDANKAWLFLKKEPDYKAIKEYGFREFD